MSYAGNSRTEKSDRRSYWKRISDRLKTALGYRSGCFGQRPLRIAIANFSEPLPSMMDFRSDWKAFRMPPQRKRRQLFENRPDWGFHIYAPGVYLMDNQLADRVEFWDFSDKPSASYHSNGVLRILFANKEDIAAYLEFSGYPDLFINHGRSGRPVLDLMEGKCFRVHVPALRYGLERQDNWGAECFLVDDEQFLDGRSMMYIPVVNTKQICPNGCEKVRDFIYLAANYESKRHDILLNAFRGTELTGHLHPVDAAKLDLSDTHITASGWDEGDVVELLRTSRMAVYTGECTSNPAAMWECVAAGLPIVMNRSIMGGKHLVIPGVTGELASDTEFYDVTKRVLANLGSYQPREYFEEHWDTIRILDQYLSFFVDMGWPYSHVVDRLTSV
jgi:glycosyltransferase involved in cell wall biosynthesis